MKILNVLSLCLATFILFAMLYALGNGIALLLPTGLTLIFAAIGLLVFIGCCITFYFISLY